MKKLLIGIAAAAFMAGSANAFTSDLGTIYQPGTGPNPVGEGREYTTDGYTADEVHTRFAAAVENYISKGLPPALAEMLAGFTFRTHMNHWNGM